MCASDSHSISLLILRKCDAIRRELLENSNFFVYDKHMKRKLLAIPFIALSLTLTACPFSLSENDEWKKSLGKPELLLENSKNESYVYLYEDQHQYKDTNNIIREAIKEAAPFEEINSRSVPDDVRFFTYEASWIPATSGPNYEHLSIWQNGFVRIDHKKSLGSHKYLYFSIDEEKATTLVELVFSIIDA